MVKVYCVGHDYTYEIMELLKLFFPAEELQHIADQQQALKDSYIMTRLTVTSGILQAEVEISIDGQNKRGLEAYVITNESSLFIKKKSKQLLKRVTLRLLSDIKAVALPWGVLTGIRPTKIVHELLEEGYSHYDILQLLQSEYLIAPDKAELLMTVAKTEHSFVYPINEELISLYISIPFCPTRCVYCSFPSNPMQQWGHLMEDYVDALCKELRMTAELVRQRGKAIETIYIGGGTPTTLSLEGFTRIFDLLESSFDLKQLKELTVEAGRPDTIDSDKLKLLKARGVTRLSINPQTMNDCTLVEIGRSHSVADLKRAFLLAREAGFDNINMDLIVGLPGEDEAMVCNTMEEIIGLEPENLTVHTLAIKKASRLKEKSHEYALKEEETIVNMLAITQDYAKRMGLKPYYMYRQKHMLGHLENIGYCKPGYEGIYNIQIMEEKQTILAFGAGGVSKMVYPRENRLERVPNVKNLEHYLQRVEEMVERKKDYLKD